MSSTTLTEKEVKELIKGKLARYFGLSPKEATKDQIYKAVVMTVRDILLEKRQESCLRSRSTICPIIRHWKATAF